MLSRGMLNVESPGYGRRKIMAGERDASGAGYMTWAAFGTVFKGIERTVLPCQRGPEGLGVGKASVTASYPPQGAYYTLNSP